MSDKAETFVMTTDQMDELAVTVAQKKAMQNGPVFLAHGTRLFSVQQGWESSMIAKDPHAVQCDSLLTLETAFQNEAVKVIFIPLTAMIDQTGLERVCQRHGVAKTIFREVEEV